MSLQTMIAEMRGAVPGYSALLARTHLREAWTDIRNMSGWSFQLGIGSFSTPGKVSSGTVTVQLGSEFVIGDTDATAAWLIAGTPLSLLSMRQFRIGAGTIYNIIAYDDGTDTAGANYPFATLTLDRYYSDLTTDNSPQTGNGYTIYQPYIATPVKEFEAWEAVCDTTNVIWLATKPTKAERARIDRADPQRQIFSNPGTLLINKIDDRPNSATLGYMLYELYPQPQAQYAYQTWYTWKGPDLALPTDTVPYPITEHVVKAKARVKAYEWAEANKDPANPRGNGADYRFLIGAALAEYNASIKDIRLLDRDRVDMWSDTMTRITGFGPVSTFNPATGQVTARNL